MVAVSGRDVLRGNIMIIIMRKDAKESSIQRVLDIIRTHGYDVHYSRGKDSIILGVTLSPELFQSLSDVERVIRISGSYKLVSRMWQETDTTFRVGEATVGGSRFLVIAGPCAIESREQLLETAAYVKENGADILRGGAFKPRTSPYSFQGLGLKGLELLAEAREQTGLPVITEVLSEKDVPMVAEYADILQIGARNMQNFALLKAVGRVNKPVMLKRGLSATIEEWLLAAEYIAVEGNNRIILCERGIRTYETATRNTLDISAVPVVRQLSHLPLIIDPSHATGKREFVIPMARAALAAGAQGIMVEVHPNPDVALCDGRQSLTFDMFHQMIRELRAMDDALRSVGAHIRDHLESQGDATGAVCSL